jgi:hypothetical protein
MTNRANKERFGQDSSDDEPSEEVLANRASLRKEEDTHESLFALSITPGTHHTLTLTHSQTQSNKPFKHILATFLCVFTSHIFVSLLLFFFALYSFCSTSLLFIRTFLYVQMVQMIASL